MGTNAFQLPLDTKIPALFRQRFSKTIETQYLRFTISFFQPAQNPIQQTLTDQK